jgi:hypothetical protein
MEGLDSTDLNTHIEVYVGFIYIAAIILATQIILVFMTGQTTIRRYRTSSDPPPSPILSL